MSKQINPTVSLSFLGIGIALLQLFDIIIHAATNQMEILRVSSNVIVLLWLAAVASGRFNARFLPIAAGSIGIYLVLNIVFLALEGLTNVEQGGELRVMLFLLMFLTITLSTLLVYIKRR
jgi:hypothetical protein